MLVELRNPFWQSEEDVVLEDYVSFGEDAKQYNGEFDESTRSDGQFFFDDEGIDIEYNVQSSEDAGIDDDVDEYFLVDEDNEILDPDFDVYLFGISMDLPFDNIGVTNLVLDDVLEGGDVDVINADDFDGDPVNDEETNYRKRRLAELKTEMEGVINASGQWKMNLKLYKNDGVRIRARCDGKVLVFTMSQGTGPTGPNRGMEFGLNGSSGPTTRSKKRKNTVRVNPEFPIKAVQDQLQRELEVQISMSKDFRAKCKAEREIRGDHDKDMVAFGLNLKQCIYPLAYALVEARNDRQKGIISAIKTVYPTAYSINVRDFEKCTLELKTMNPNEHEWLNKIPAEHWARSHFSGRAKSDLLLNSICEVFNGKIVRGGNNAEAGGSASRQAQQTELVVGQDGSGGSGAGAVLDFSAAGKGAAGGPSGAGVARQVSQTRNEDGREMGDGVPTQSSAAGGAREWSFM
ncbi:hypothetical protein Tco_1284787 [Tanacetum coccineum]